MTGLNSEDRHNREVITGDHEQETKVYLLFIYEDLQLNLYYY